MVVSTSLPQLVATLDNIYMGWGSNLRHSTYSSLRGEFLVIKLLDNKKNNYMIDVYAIRT